MQKQIDLFPTTKSRDRHRFNTMQLDYNTISSSRSQIKQYLVAKNPTYNPQNDKKSISSSKQIELKKQRQRRRKQLLQQLQNLDIEDIKFKDNYKQKDLKYFIKNKEKQDQRTIQANKYAKKLKKNKQKFYGQLMILKQNQQKKWRDKQQIERQKQQQQKQRAKQIRLQQASENIKIMNQRIKKRMKDQQRRKQKQLSVHKTQANNQSIQLELPSIQKKKHKSINISYPPQQKILYKNKFHKQFDGKQINQQQQIRKFVQKKRQYAEKLRRQIKYLNQIQKQKQRQQKEKFLRTQETEQNKQKKNPLSRNQGYKLGNSYLQIAKQASGFEQKAQKIIQQRNSKIFNLPLESSSQTQIIYKTVISNNDINLKPHMNYQFEQEQKRLNKLESQLKFKKLRKL